MNREYSQKGTIHFLTLLLVALTLIGVVGYVSVKRIQSTQGNNFFAEGVLGQNTGKKDSIDEDIDLEESELDSVDTLEKDISDLDRTFRQTTPMPPSKQDSVMDDNFEDSLESEDDFVSETPEPSKTPKPENNQEVDNESGESEPEILTTDRIPSIFDKFFELGFVKFLRAQFHF